MNSDCSGANTTYSDPDTFKKSFGESNINIYKVDCISLDEIIDNYNIESVELLKIDCEGAEYDILYNSTYFKNNIIKNIVGEFHDLHYNTQIETTNNNGEELIKYCKKYTNIINLTVLIF